MIICARTWFILSIMLSVFTASLFAAPIQIYTEEFSPFQISNKQGDVSGLATDIVTNIFNHANIEHQIEIYPWFRAVHTVEKTPDTFIYSMARTNERENKFIWIAPLCHLEVSFYRLKSRNDIEINSLEDAKTYVTAVAAGQPSEAFLINHGFNVENNLVVVASHEQSAGMLPKDRIDLIFGADLFIENVQHIFQMDTLWQKVYTEPKLSKTMFLAANIHTSQALIEQLKESYSTIKPQLISNPDCPQASF
ncbi:transporter substrate-binding domain-containing protein [Pseudoalteromonas tunicata]|uniref:substrate-binding periplasmic protein n=1 Tax=Pseudoalteromonas tunicata TaxID=314281 RepID=UPI00273FF7FD|nr:transporter substrate-binding domain-containing protein [Pseudoalteromonas tunicata]MDP5214230.1 transporter substrate-binding domain-containing protein [Pseudoalteromonas tunicata]